MLIENMKMAFSAIRANKMRSALTMLGIIIGIGSVISIVSIGDTMRGLFADLYKDVGITQAYFSIGYWVDDVRQNDYFNLDEMERAREAFSDQIAYIDSSAFTSDEASYKRTKIKFEYQGIDYNYQDVQPVDMVYGRYLNEGDILGRKKNVVMDTDSARMLLGWKMQWARLSGPPCTAPPMILRWWACTGKHECLPGPYDGRQQQRQGVGIHPLYPADMAQ